MCPVNRMSTYDVCFLIFEMVAFMAAFIPIVSAAVWNDNGPKDPKGSALVTVVVWYCFEPVIASLLGVLLLVDVGTFHVRSCGVQSISDWYPALLQSPSSTSPECTSEVVFPL